MPVKSYKPITPSRRTMTVLDFSDLTKKRPERSLIVKVKRHSGHNHHGRVTSRFRGGGHRRLYRVIDFRRAKDGVPAKVAAIEYDPNRSARIALLHYADGEKRYILAPVGVTVGQAIMNGPEAEVRGGNCLPLRAIPVGTTIHAVELKPGKGAQLARGAGASVQLLAREGAYATLRLPSGEMRKVSVECRATIGQVGNLDHENVEIGKAGRMRWKGRRPHNRGMAMNPVDHPNGGGEGRSKSGGGWSHPRSPWGQLAKGQKTRKPKKASNRLIVKRRK